MSATPFHRVQHVTLAERVRREIERRILAGEVEAGSRLSEVELARSMGVSRGPVREALRALAESGLVDVVANRGVVVRRIGVREALDLYELRAVVFALACEQFALRHDDAQLAELVAILRRQEEAVAAGERERYYELNLAFHAAIVAGCGNARARAVYEAVVKEMHLFRRRGLSELPNIAASLAEHRDIVEAVRRRDGEGAFRAGRRHVLAGRDRFRRTLAASERCGARVPSD